MTLWPKKDSEEKSTRETKETCTQHFLSAFFKKCRPFRSGGGDFFEALASFFDRTLVTTERDRNMSDYTKLVFLEDGGKTVVRAVVVINS